MKIERSTLHRKTSAQTDVCDLTGDVQRFVTDSAVSSGLVSVHVAGSTASISTIEFEPGAVRDLIEAVERLAPAGPEPDGSPTNLRRCLSRSSHHPLAVGRFFSRLAGSPSAFGNRLDFAPGRPFRQGWSDPGHLRARAAVWGDHGSTSGTPRATWNYPLLPSPRDRAFIVSTGRGRARVRSWARSSPLQALPQPLERPGPCPPPRGPEATWDECIRLPPLG